jgi:hypothetical protein
MSLSLIYRLVAWRTSHAKKNKTAPSNDVVQYVEPVVPCKPRQESKHETWKTIKNHIIEDIENPDDNTERRKSKELRR